MDQITNVIPNEYILEYNAAVVWFCNIDVYDC